MAHRRNQRRRNQVPIEPERVIEDVEDKEIEEEIDSDVELEARGPSGKDEKRDSEDESEDEAEEEHRVTFASVNDLHRGCYVMMKGAFPCKIQEVARSKQGKHGSAKVSIVGLDIFTGKKYEDLYPSSKNVEIPEVLKVELEVLGLQNNQLLVKHKDNKPHHPLAIPNDEMGERIRSLVNARANVIVQLQCAMGKEKIVQARERRGR